MIPQVTVENNTNKKQGKPYSSVPTSGAPCVISPQEKQSLDSENSPLNRKLPSAADSFCCSPPAAVLPAAALAVWAAAAGLAAVALPAAVGPVAVGPDAASLAATQPAVRPSAAGPPAAALAVWPAVASHAAADCLAKERPTGHNTFCYLICHLAQSHTLDFDENQHPLT